MRNITKKKSKLPFNSYLLCVSLVSASILLILIFLLHFMSLISTKIAIWASICVFLLAATYEIFLVSLLTKFIFRSINKKPNNSSVNKCSKLHIK